MKSLKEEPIQEGEIIETHWDVKKIAVGLVVLALLLIAGSYLFLPKSDSNNQERGVLGVSESKVSTVQDVPPLPSKQDVQNVLSSAQTALSQITSDNLTSSQAAIQKVISDLSSLQDKKDAVGVFCEVVCKNK